MVQETELLKKYKETGELDLLGQLYAPYMHLVLGICMKYFKDKGRSEDAVMQIFEKLIKDLCKHEVSNFKSWLHVTVRNFCLMEIRKTKNQENISVESMEFALPAHHEEEDTLDEANLEACIETLKADQKKCIELFYLKEKCYQDIAELIVLDLKKVKSHIQNGKRNLKICIEGKREAI